MGANRTTAKRSGKSRSLQSHSQIERRLALDQAAELVGTVCRLAGVENLINSEPGQLRQVILKRDTPRLFEHLLESFSLQGVSDHAAYTYMDKHGRLTWCELQRATSRPPACPKLHCYWSFHSCGFRKASRTCAEPKRISSCPLTRHDLRNGRLNQTAYSLFLFIRDVMNSDLVGWIDQSLRRASPGRASDRARRIRSALIEPLRNVFGVSDKILNMTLADVLMAAPPNRPLWSEAGSSMIAIDTLVHNFLQRTGILRSCGTEHAYGKGCYGSDGCAAVVARIAAQIDARQFNPAYPRFFPRFVQHAIWRYCAQSELGICNGNNTDDRFRCGNKECPLFDRCDRVALHTEASAR